MTPDVHFTKRLPGASASLVRDARPRTGHDAALRAQASRQCLPWGRGPEVLCSLRRTPILRDPQEHLPHPPSLDLGCSKTPQPSRLLLQETSQKAKGRPSGGCQGPGPQPCAHGEKQTQSSRPDFPALGLGKSAEPSAGG